MDEMNRIVICKHCGKPEYSHRMRRISGRFVCRNCYEEQWNIENPNEYYPFDDLGRRPTKKEYEEQHNKKYIKLYFYILDIDYSTKPNIECFESEATKDEFDIYVPFEDFPKGFGRTRIYDANFGKVFCGNECSKKVVVLKEKDTKKASNIFKEYIRFFIKESKREIEIQKENIRKREKYIEEIEKL